MTRAKAVVHSRRVNKHMGCIIRCKGAPILYLSNQLMDRLYKALVLEAENTCTIKNEKISHFLESMDQDIYGIGAIYADVAKSFEQDTHSLALFLAILDRAINSLMRTYPEAFINTLKEFKDSIAKYLDSINL